MTATESAPADPAPVATESAGSPPEVRARLDVARPLFIVCVGRKGSGKSHLARRLFHTFPGDRVCIDPTGDVAHAFPEGYFRDLPLGVQLRELPRRDDDRGYVRWRLQPKRSRPSYLDDMDRTIALTMDHGRRRGRVMLWVDEAGRVAKRDKVLPHMSEALEEGRHANLSMILCMPRPVDVDPLVIGQADYVYAFDLPQPTDRQRLASIAGVDTDVLDEAIETLPDHGYVRFDAAASKASGLRLVSFPPIPEHLT